MKRFFVGTLLLCLLLSARTFADGIIIGYSPNDGSGDNFGFFIYNANGFVAGNGGTPADFFNTLGYAPGSILGGSTDLFFSGGLVKSGPNFSDVSFEVGTLFLGTIVLPTNGRDFLAPASVGFSATGTLATTLETIDVGGGAEGHIKFDFFNGAYYPESFVQAPEPGTLGLLGMGLLGVVARVRSRVLGRR